MTMPATLERAPDTMASLPTEKTSELPPLPHTQRVKIIYAGEGAATPGTRARLIRRRGGELVTEPLYVDVMPNRSVALTIGDLFQVNQCGVPCTLYVLIAEQAGVLPETRAQVERMLQTLPDPVSIFVD